MTFYSLILFVHVTAVLVLFAVSAFEVLSLFHLRRATTLDEVRVWIDPVPGLPRAAMGSLLAVVFSGIYLAIRLSALGEAWPKVAMAAILFIAPIAAITGRRMRTIRRACATAVAIDSGFRRQLQDPFLKVSIGIRIAVTLGIVLLMGSKPELRESMEVIGASAVLGVVASLPGRRGTGSMAASNAGVGQ